jgi:aminoglycoside phosphotransferase
VPPAGQQIPAAVSGLANGRPLRPDLDREASRLRWARRFTAVPKVLDRGTDASGEWLLTAGLPGDSAVSDRWADLAVATWSIDWNYGLGWQRVLLDAYGVAPDPERTAYYRLRWDLSP